MYRVILTLTFKEPGGTDFGMTTNILEFQTRASVMDFMANVDTKYPKNAIHATAVVVDDIGR